MTAKDKFIIEKRPIKKKQIKLSDLMSNNFMICYKVKSIIAKLPEFTIGDGIKYSIGNHIGNKEV